MKCSALGVKVARQCKEGENIVQSFTKVFQSCASVNLASVSFERGLQWKIYGTVDVPKFRPYKKKTQQQENSRAHTFIMAKEPPKMDGILLI
jgi:hypothetical protein